MYYNVASLAACNEKRCSERDIYFEKLINITFMQAWIFNILWIIKTYLVKRYSVCVFT